MRVETFKNQSLEYDTNQHTLLRIGMKVVAYMAAIGFAILSLMKVTETSYADLLPSLTTLSGFSLINFLTFRYLS